MFSTNILTKKGVHRINLESGVDRLKRKQSDTKNQQDTFLSIINREHSLAKMYMDKANREGH